MPSPPPATTMVRSIRRTLSLFPPITALARMTVIIIPRAYRPFSTSPANFATPPPPPPPPSEPPSSARQQQQQHQEHKLDAPEPFVLSPREQQQTQASSSSSSSSSPPPRPRQALATSEQYKQFEHRKAVPKGPSLSEDPPPSPEESEQAERSPITTNPYLIYNRYKARKVWPPDVTQLSVQEQLRWEKKYKRRILKATECADWKRWIRFTQFVSIPAVVIYILLFAKFDEEVIPFYPVRKEVYSWFGVDIGPELTVPKKRGMPVDIGIMDLGVLDKENKFKKDR
ncbi:hypothetical protein MKZ38_006815 [Zalerion maritima]|uniref:Uncharacterized protein n=1 Tax=Zalerion maritima TaxID=339359 RepID=A0AAD5RW57_9PEZI|nr:hypothetical protein MKZ38_006815 [Zalerion maritima]